MSGPLGSLLAQRSTVGMALHSDPWATTPILAIRSTFPWGTGPLSRDNNGCLQMYGPGDYIKAEFRDDRPGEVEWIWVKVEADDPALRVVFGTLDNEPLVCRALRLGMHLAVSYDNILEHRTAASFNPV